MSNDHDNGFKLHSPALDLIGEFIDAVVTAIAAAGVIALVCGLYAVINL